MWLMLQCGEDPLAGSKRASKKLQSGTCSSLKVSSARRPLLGTARRRAVLLLVDSAKTADAHYQMSRAVGSVSASDVCL